MHTAETPPPAAAGPKYYRVFGGTLRSEMPLPRLQPVEPRLPDWTLRVDGSEPAPGGKLIGRDVLAQSVEIHLFRTAHGYRLEYSDTGTFDVAANGSEIVWRPGSRRDQDVIGQDFLGRVMALALHAAGLVCLHGSAVGVKGGAIGFLGSKHAGKSTLAQALVEGGATLISDDMLAIDIQSTAFVRPGLPQVRLWSDSAARLGGPGVSRSIGAGGKHVLEPEDASLEFRAQPCAALYLLAPVRGGADAAARRTPVEPVAATAFLIGQNKLGRLLASAETARLFALYGKLARDVPVYRLEVSRGYDQLPEVVRQLKAWHEPVD